MSTQMNSGVRHSTLSYLALRQALGILGLALPVLIWIFNGFELKSSISHFYYSSSSVIFTGFMVAFGIFLIFYPGRQDDSVRISDNWVTSLGGAGAILTALIPTAYNSLCEAEFKYSLVLEGFCGHEELSTQFIHNHSILGTVHLGSAAVFLLLMGFMSFSRFTKGNTPPRMKRFYRFCAFMIWLPIAALGVKFAFGFEWTEHDVYIFECISISFFGLAWLVKGKTFKRFGLT